MSNNRAHSTGSGPASESAAEPAQSPPRALLLDRGFLTLWGVGGLNSTGRWLEMLVVAIFVLDTTHSPLLVASMLMLRLLPMALFGAVGGVIAQRYRRLTILRVAVTTIVLCALWLAWLADAGLLQVWHVGVGAFVSGLAWSTDFPVRRTLMSDIAGPERVGRAMSLDILVGAGTRTLGPLLGGWLYSWIGLQGAFALAAGLYFLSGLLLFLRKEFLINARRDEVIATTDSLRKSLIDGFKALSSSRSLPGIIAVTVVFNLWGFPFVSMVPVVGRDVFGLDPTGVGWLVSAEGAGALIGAIALSVFAKSRQSRIIYAIGTVAYCAFAFGFSQTQFVWLSAAWLLGLGFASAAFGSMQSALILMNAPLGKERAMMGLLSVAIGTAPLGFLHIGLLANWLGAQLACTLVALEGLTAMGVVLWKWPALLQPQPLRT